MFVCFSAIYLIAQCDYHGSLEITIINGRSVSQYVWYVKKTLTAQWSRVPSRGHNLQPFTGYSDFLRWMKNYLEWNDKPQTNKRTKTVYSRHLCVMFKSINNNVIWFILFFMRWSYYLFDRLYFNKWARYQAQISYSAYLNANLTISIKKKILKMVHVGTA